jgi:hypothetical protein
VFGLRLRFSRQTAVLACADFLFLKAEREKAQQDGTTPSGGDAYKAFTKALGEKWAALSEADKAVRQCLVASHRRAAAAHESHSQPRPRSLADLRWSLQPYNEEAARLKGAYADELDAYKSKRASAAPDAGSPADDGPQDVTDTVSVRGSDSAAGSPDGEEPERRAKKKLPSKKRSSDAGAERPTKRAHKEEPAVKKRLALPMNPKASSMSEASGSQ